jgi:HK97 family phage portal protein
VLGRLVERRGAFQELWGSGALFERGTPTGKNVTDNTALTLSAVYASIRLIADTVSTLPYDQFIRRDGQRFPFRPREMWVMDPNPHMDRTTFWQQVVTSLLMDGNAFVLLTRSDEGDIVQMDVLNPQRTKVYIANGSKTYRVNESMTVPAENMLHLTELLLPGAVRGVSRIEKAKDALGLGLALEEYASRFFGNGAFAGGVIEWPGDITKDQAKTLVDSWEGNHKGLHRSHRPAVLYGGAKFTTTTVDPSQSQLLEERRFAIEEVARIFRVPPFMLGVTTAGSVSYNSVEQQMLFFMQHTIQPMVQKLEIGFSRLLQNEQSFLKFNLNSMVRADLATRTESYSKALLAGYMSVNDVRALEDMRSVENGDEYRVPLQNIPLADTPVVTLQQKARAAQALTTAGFTGESVAELLGLDLEHTGQLSVQVQPVPEDGEG